MNEATIALMAVKRGIDATLLEIASLSANHFGVGPDDVDWEHVNNLRLCLRALEAAAGYARGDEET